MFQWNPRKKILTSFCTCVALHCIDCRVNGGGGEGGGGMRTVECLRGRLLAERVASKAAKEEADQLAKRVQSYPTFCNTFSTVSSSSISIGSRPD